VRRAASCRIQSAVALARTKISEINAHAPDVLMIDLDHLPGDCLESVRQLRFVLPECTIAVLTSTFETRWAKRCHAAGACGVLPGGGSEAQILIGLQQALLTGAYTDAHFNTRPRLNELLRLCIKIRQIDALYQC